MPKSIEAEGVTVDEAIQNALNALGLGRDSVEIEILHHPRSGFLGIGARRAKVRATLREQVMRDGEEFDMAPDSGGRGRRRRRSGRRRTPRGGEGRPPDTRSTPQPAASAGRRSGPATGAPSETPGSANESAAVRPGGGSGDESGRGGRGGRRRGGRRSGRGSDGPRVGDSQQSRQGSTTAASHGDASTGGAAPQAPSDESTEKRDARDRAPRPASAARRPDLDELLQRALEKTRELMSQMGFEGNVTGAVEGASLSLSVNASDGGAILIGRRGTTLDAIEHVIGRMTLGVEPGSRVRVAVDVCGYRERRKTVLVELAGKLKTHALATGRKTQITPLSPQDRSVFLDALAGDDAVSTRALGTGFYRRVLLIPKGIPNGGMGTDDFGEDGNLLSAASSESGESRGDDPDQGRDRSGLEDVPGESEETDPDGGRPPGAD
jgi:spoIIIJ-associated protein